MYHSPFSLLCFSCYRHKPISSENCIIKYLELRIIATYERHPPDCEVPIAGVLGVKFIRYFQNIQDDISKLDNEYYLRHLSRSICSRGEV
jgi:hypothetical protein